MRSCFSRRFLAVMLILGLAASASGCTGKKVPSYKDRIGTIDPATAPIAEPPALK